MNILCKIFIFQLLLVACKNTPVINNSNSSKVESKAPVSAPETPYIAELVTDTYPGYYDPANFRAFITQCISSTKKLNGVNAHSVRNADGSLAFSATAAGMKNAQNLKVSNELCFKNVYRDPVGGAALN